jgi:cell division protein FtsN
VRTGPYAHRDEADAARQKLTEAGVEAALVRVQK